MRLVIITILFSQSVLAAQNLVPNASFEELKDTVSGFTDNDLAFIAKIQSWTTPNTASPDLIAPGFYERYIQPPAPHAGSAMVGIQAKTSWAEYVGVQLTEALIPNRTYYVEYWIRRANCINPQMDVDQVMNDRFGMLFLPQAIKIPNGELLNGNPQIVPDTQTLITDQAWVKISGYFTPQRECQYLYIGQFGEEGGRPEIMTGYYVLDDVLVKTVTDYGGLNEDVPLPVGSIIPLNSVNFISGTAVLSDVNSYDQLQEVATYLNRNPSLRMRINGHTDAVGNERANLQLSRKRARFVAQYLVEQGISKDRIESKGFGENQPIADNTTSSGRLQNRRVEFEVIE